MLDLLIAVHFAIFYVANLWARAGIVAALIVYERSINDADTVASWLPLVWQPLVGYVSAYLLRLVHGDRASLYQRLWPTAALDGSLGPMLYAGMFILTLLPYRNAVVDEDETPFPLGAVVSMLLMLGLAIVLEVYTYYADAHAHAQQHQQRLSGGRGSTAAAAAAAAVGLFHHADVTQHLKVAGVAVCWIIVDLLAFELVARWQVAVAAGILGVQVVGSRAFDALLDRLEATPVRTQRGKTHQM